MRAHPLARVIDSGRVMVGPSAMIDCCVKEARAGQ